MGRENSTSMGVSDDKRNESTVPSAKMAAYFRGQCAGLGGNDYSPVKEPDCTAFRIRIFSTLSILAKLVFDLEKIKERWTKIFGH
jgi:hypothetical protein